MAAKSTKSSSCSESPAEGLTIYDAPNVCRELMANCQSLAQHDDPAVAKLGQAMALQARQMLDAIVGSVDQLLALAE